MTDSTMYSSSETQPYNAAGSFAVSTLVTDIGGSTASASSAAQIAAPGPPSGPPVARLTVTPNPTCTDVLTKLDASASSAPAGIVSYRFHYSQPINQLGLVRSEDVLANEGSSNATYYAFTWNRAPSGRGPIDGLADNGYVEGWRDPPDVTVTVTDARGATATATVRVTFVQGNSADDRTGCPRDFSPPYSFPFAPGKNTFPKLTIAPAGVSTSLPCRSRIVCMGTISLVLANPNGTIAR